MGVEVCNGTGDAVQALATITVVTRQKIRSSGMYDESSMIVFSNFDLFFCLL